MASLKRRKTGWLVTWDVGVTPDGKRRQRAKMFPSHAEAKRYKATLEASTSAGFTSTMATQDY